MPRQWEEGAPTPAASNLSVVDESGLKEEAATSPHRTFSPSFYPRRHASLQGKRGMREEGVVAPPCAARAIRLLLLTTMEDMHASDGILRAGSMGCRYRTRCCWLLLFQATDGRSSLRASTYQAPSVAFDSWNPKAAG
jgi:hypothetical protein